MIPGLMEKVIEALKSIFEPEIPVNIYDLGLVYRIEVNESGEVYIDMTLTSPNCPAAQSLPEEVIHKVGELQGVSRVVFNLVWDPPWDPDKMSEAAKLELNML